MLLFWCWQTGSAALYSILFWLVNKCTCNILNWSGDKSVLLVHTLPTPNLALVDDIVQWTYLPSPATQWTATQHPGSSLNLFLRRLNHSSMTSPGGGVPSSNWQSCKCTSLLLSSFRKCSILRDICKYARIRNKDNFR